MNIAEGAGITRYEMLALVTRLALVAAAGFFSMRWIMSQMDPMMKAKRKAKFKAQEQLKKLRSSKNDNIVDFAELNDYEMIIATHLVDPQDIPVSWENIAGLDSVIQELKENVILPIKRKELFEDSRLTRAPKGVLLYGPPGCGKTMIAKATARESGTCFINLDVSILTDKWYGESQKLTAAVFSLAVKLQPCIIFIDEIDSFLRNRNSQDHEATAMMKAQFMSLWDGLISHPACVVIIMGATNRPQDLDRAILRRMPATFHIGLPNQEQRQEILKLILEREPIAPNVDVTILARLTEAFSGSDIHELCRTASLYRVRDYSREHPCVSNNEPSENSHDEEFHDALRPITQEDFITAFRRLKSSKVDTGSIAGMAKIDLD